jgi:hypothetical protein
MDTVSVVTTPKGGQRAAGFVGGSLIATMFGAVFVLVNSGGLASLWTGVIRGFGLLVAVLLVVGVVLVVRRTSSEPGVPATGFVDRRYWLIVALEAGTLFGGLAVINGVLHRPAVAVAWVSVVVGVHFFGLGAIWHMRFYHWLGATMTALGVAGFLIYALGGPATVVGLVAGVGSGVALYVTVAIGVTGALLGRRP